MRGIKYGFKQWQEVATHFENLLKVKEICLLECMEERKFRNNKHVNTVYKLLSGNKKSNSKGNVQKICTLGKSQNDQWKNILHMQVINFKMVLSSFPG